MDLRRILGKKRCGTSAVRTGTRAVPGRHPLESLRQPTPQMRQLALQMRQLAARRAAFLPAPAAGRFLFVPAVSPKGAKKEQFYDKRGQKYVPFDQK